MTARTVEDELDALAKRAVQDASLKHPIAAIGIAIAYADGRVAGIINLGTAPELLLAAVARLEHQVQRKLDSDGSP